MLSETTNMRITEFFLIFIVETIKAKMLNKQTSSTINCPLTLAKRNYHPRRNLPGVFMCCIIDGAKAVAKPDENSPQFLEPLNLPGSLMILAHMLMNKVSA